MLLSANDSLNAVFQKVVKQLQQGPVEKGHPFQLVPMATQSAKTIDSRYVILREVDESLNFYFYSDSRTEKIRDLRSSSRIALLFYHPDLQVQVRINGEGQLHYRDEISSEHWEKVPQRSRQAYWSEAEPGEPIEQPTDAHHWLEEADDRWFTVVRVIPKSIDVLQLDGTEHIRALFRRRVDGWEKQWVAP